MPFLLPNQQRQSTKGNCLHIVKLIPLHPQTLASLASSKSKLVLPFWYRLTQVIQEKRLLNGCSSTSSSSTEETIIAFLEPTDVFHMHLLDTN